MREVERLRTGKWFQPYHMPSLGENWEMETFARERRTGQVRQECRAAVPSKVLLMEAVED